jgi:hypothetical protein
MLATTLPHLTAARLVEALLPMLSARVRREFEVSGTGASGNAVLRVEGKRATPAAVSLGVVEVLAERLSVKCSARITREENELLEITLEPTYR